MKQRDEDLAREIEHLKQKIEDMEHLAKGRGLSGLLHFRNAHTTEDGKEKHSWSQQKSNVAHIISWRTNISLSL